MSVPPPAASAHGQSASAPPFGRGPGSICLPVSSTVSLWTRYDAQSGMHYLTCDLCGYEVYAAKGHATNMLSHRQISKRCKERQAVMSRTGAFSTPKMSNTQAASPQTPKRPSHYPCPAAPVTWELGSFWTTYPFQDHISDSLGWLPCGFDVQRNKIYFRADNCLNKTSIENEACRACISVVSSAPFQRMKRRAAFAKPNTPYHRLTQSQLVAVAQFHLADKKRLRSKIQALHHRHRMAMQRVQDHERILLLLSQRDVQRLRWVLSSAMRAGSSPRKILSVVTLAADGRYRARGFDPKLRDLSFLSAYAGGERMHVAMCRGLGLLSKRTLERHAAVPRLMPSITAPSKAEVDHNISAFLDPDIRPPPVPAGLQSLHPGNILMFDGVALETRARYDQRRDQVLGLARETAGNVDTRAATVENIERIRHALQEKTVHFGTEATVVAVAPYSQREHYTPVPLISSPSNKTERAPELKEWLSTVLDAWDSHPLGRASQGPIWSLGSDGDSTYEYRQWP